MPSAISSNEPAGDAVGRYRAITAAAIFALVAGSAAGIAVPAGLQWDFANFYDTGRRIAAGQVRDLYDSLSWIAGAPPQGRMRFWGAPISAWLYWPLSFLPPRPALVAFKIENTLAILGGIALLSAHFRRLADPSPTGRWRFAAACALLALLYQPFWTVYRVGGQSTPTVFLLVVIALLAHTAGRFAPSAGLLVLAALIKPAFAPLPLLVALASGLRSIAWTAGAFAAAGAVSLAVMGWNVHREFLALMLEGLGTPRYGWYNCSLYAWIQNLELLDRPGLAEGTLTPALSVTKVLVLASFAFLVYRGKRQGLSETGRRHLEFLLAVAFLLLLSGILWEHYLSILFPVLLHVTAARRYFRREAMWWIGGIVFFASMQSVFVIEVIRRFAEWDSVASIVALGLFKSSPLLLLAGFLWRHWRELLRSHEAVP